MIDEICNQDLYLGHMSEAIAEFCVLKKIKLWLLKPFSTHVKQPLDVSTFGPFKIYVFQLIRVWQSRNFGESLSKYQVILEAAYPALEKVFLDPDLVKSGFRQSGLFPWNPAAIDTREIRTSVVESSEVRLVIVESFITNSTFVRRLSNVSEIGISLVSLIELMISLLSFDLI